MGKSAVVKKAEIKRSAPLDSRTLTRQRASRELVFGVIGHIGSGTSAVANSLKDVLEREFLDGGNSCAVIKARDVIMDWARRHGESVPDNPNTSIADIQRLQDLGDLMRSAGDHASVARGVVLRIRESRAQMQGVKFALDEPVVPDGQARAYIIDSIRHPDEIKLLRHLYGDAFVLVGVVCELSERKSRISNKFRDAGLDAAESLMERDAKAAEKYGQRVSSAFHMADFFIDNTPSRFLDDDPSRPNPDWDINDHLMRLIRLVTHEKVERPRIEETAMYEAAGAAMRSACLSRQVGAALLDCKGNIVATGTNEVPKAGGGVYGEQFDGEDVLDDRCCIRNKFCSNTREQNHIANAILSELEDQFRDNVDRTELVSILKSGRIGELLEFSRAVHAEMDALLDAGRKGVCTVGCRLYVTTFPCHYCARHIVSAGIDEVQYIEPYPKSKAFDLHSDSILNDRSTKDWKPPSDGGNKVLFRPFTGVAPRMYGRAFQKDRELKDGMTGDMSIRPPDWGAPYDNYKTSYAEFEVTLTRDLVDDNSPHQSALSPTSRA